MGIEIGLLAALQAAAAAAAEAAASAAATEVVGGVTAGQIAATAAAGETVSVGIAEERAVEKSVDASQAARQANAAVEAAGGTAPKLLDVSAPPPGLANTAIPGQAGKPHPARQSGQGGSATRPITASRSGQGPGKPAPGTTPAPTNTQRGASFGKRALVAAGSSAASSLLAGKSDTPRAPATPSVRNANLSAQQAAERERRMKRGRGRAGTILTSPLGATSQPNVAVKRLLGQ